MIKDLIAGLEPIAPLAWYWELAGMLALVGLVALVDELLEL